MSLLLHQGLALMGFGLMGVFLVLAAFIGMIAALVRFFRKKSNPAG